MSGRLTLASLLVVAIAAAEEPAAPPGFAGSDTCVACHSEQAETHDKTPHAAPLADPSRPLARQGCEACHGPGQAHVDEGGGAGVGGIESFAPDRPARARSAPCLGCHAGAATLHGWKGSEHAFAGIACNGCHRLHTGTGRTLLAKPLPDLCYGCHAEIRARFLLPEHHRVNEGVVSCLDCHQPHASRTPRQLRGANQRVCFRCHANLEGPFVFEHEGLVTEACERCHDPHGSVNRHLLIRQQVAQVCYECHTVTPPSHVQPRFRDCTRCHVDIHGSNHDPRFLE